MQALLAHADSERYRCLLELMLAAGLRIGEALALCDLDRKHSLIRVECQLGRDGQRTPLKTEESRRAIDIPPQLLRRLLALVEERGQLFNPGALVFASRNETGLVRKVAREALKRAVKAANLAPPEPTLHDLRHSHASMLIALDVSVVAVQRRLGHRKATPPSASTRTNGRSARPGAARSASNSASSSMSARRSPPPPRASHGSPCRQQRRGQRRREEQ
jgi:integrase